MAILNSNKLDSPLKIISRLFAHRLLFIVVLSLPIAVYGQSTMQVELSDVTQKVSRWNDSIKSLCVRIENQHLNNPSDDIVTIVTAAKGKKRYYSSWHGPEELKDLDPRTATQFYDGKVFDLLFHYIRRYETTARYANEDYLWKVQQSMYFEAIGWWPSTDDSSPPTTKGEPCFLPDILSDPRLHLNGTKVIRGNSCHILAIPNVLRMYVDSKSGVIHQREQVREKDGKQKVWATLEFRDFRECNGVLIPHTIERIISGVELHTLATVTSCQVNSVPDSLFTIKSPPGTMVVNRDTGEVIQIPGGLDCMDYLLDDIARHISNRSTRPYSKAYSFILMLGLFALGWVCAMKLPMQ